jgi:hypothetical protein
VLFVPQQGGISTAVSPGSSTTVRASVEELSSMAHGATAKEAGSSNEIQICLRCMALSSWFEGRSVGGMSLTREPIGGRGGLRDCGPGLRT